MRNKLIVGNWKMNLSVAESTDLAARVEKGVAKHLGSVDVVLCPAFIAVASVAKAIKKLPVGVQNVYFTDHGAFTGEVSAAQAGEVASYAIVGHSERRHLFGETNELVARKAAACLRNGLTPIICVGETQHEREDGETKQVINDQLATGLTMLTAEDMAKTVIAYEPVWAIGGGDHASPEQVAKALTVIRGVVREMFGEETVGSSRLLYGGSVDADSAGAYMGLEEVDGLLVGGASLNDHEFNAIVKKASDGKK